jgi:hypothetical protein
MIKLDEKGNEVIDNLCKADSEEAGGPAAG